jgi:hypothetical protein
LLTIGQKSGVVWALDPDDGGRIVWQTRVGKSGLLGGVQWGTATDGKTVYAAVSAIAFFNPVLDLLAIDGRNPMSAACLDRRTGRATRSPLRLFRP